MPNNINVLLIGSGAMSIEYFNVLKFLKINTTVVGRGEKSANRFKEKTSKDVFIGGFEKYSTKYSVNFTHAIISVGVEKLFDVTCKVIEYGVKNILIEKPGCLSMNEFVSLKKIIGKEKNLNVFIAYNRRFFSSIIESKKLIKKDGGVKSFNFEFTEWSHTIEPLEKAKGVKELWLIGNSTHVIDLAFYLGGKPSEISTYSTGGLSIRLHLFFQDLHKG